MLLLYLISLSLFSACLASLDKSQWEQCVKQEQACYMSPQCRGQASSEHTIVKIDDNDHNRDDKQCDFWFAMKPFTNQKVLIRSTSKKDLTVKIYLEQDGQSLSNLFSCNKTANGSGIATSNAPYKVDMLDNNERPPDNKVYCKFFLTRENKPNIFNSDVPGVRIVEVYLADTKQAYVYDQNTMKGDYDKTARCDPEIITSIPEQAKNEGYHYTDAYTERMDVSCPAKYQLVIKHNSINNGKLTKDKKLTCVNIKNEIKWKYAVPTNSPAPTYLPEDIKFHAECESTDKLCRMCVAAPDQPPICMTPSTPSNPCILPKFENGAQKGCHTFKCLDKKKKILQTNGGFSLTGAECTAIGKGNFEWRVGGEMIKSAQCLETVDCHLVTPLKQQKCNTTGCEVNALSQSIECAPGFIMTVIDGIETSTIDWIKCNRSTGQWSRSDGMALPISKSFSCVGTAELPPNNSNETGIASAQSKDSSNDIDWLLVGSCIAGGFLILIICSFVMCVLCARPKKKKEPTIPAPTTTPTSAPPTAPTSLPPSQPSTPLQQFSSRSGSAPRPSPAAVTPPPMPAAAPPVPQPIVVVVKHEHEMKPKNTIEMDSITIKGMQDEKSRTEALSQTAEKLSERTNEKSKVEKILDKSNVEKEHSKTAGTTRENTKSDVQKGKNKGKVNYTKTEDDSKEFNDAYNKELDKKLGKKEM